MDGIIERIYGAAVDPAGWQDVIDALGAHYPEGHGTLLNHDLSLGDGSFTVVSSNWHPDWVGKYNQHFARVNPWLRNLPRRPVGLAVPAEYMLDRAELKKSEFFADFLRPQNMVTGIGVTIHQDRERFLAVSYLLPDREDDRVTRDVSLLQQLAPHFRRAMQINHRLERANIEGAAAEMVLDQLATGFILLNAAGRAVFFNRSAERMLHQEDGIHLERDGTVQSLDARLAVCVSRVLEQSDEPAQEVAGALRIARPSGQPAWSVLVVPMIPRMGAIEAMRGMAAILISEEGRKSSVTADLASAFGFSMAEARVLERLVEGRSVTEAAGELQISVGTARVHLRNMFAKLGGGRQSELIRLVLSHPLWMIRRE
ncbi:helix-turn-helix transcriptional regulator [Dongia sp.]|uniref:helix-turn-helix transcriptional regulator n=1 Tax=Dongia sp. TaxID=1977262 RepID=UPI0037520435